MYKELDKFKTGNLIKGVGIFPDGREIDIPLDEYSVKLGDLIIDFINHQNKPFWKRKYYHKHLTKLYVKMLNKIEVRIGF